MLLVITFDLDVMNVRHAVFAVGVEELLCPRMTICANISFYAR